MENGSTSRIHLPGDFASLLAEAATDIGLTVSWRQQVVHYDTAGLHDSGLWSCKGQSGPVYVDDGKFMGVRAATADMLGRLMRQAHGVVVAAEDEERKSRRRDVRQQAADRSAKARVALITLERMTRRMPEAWPDPESRPIGPSDRA
jgi:hypothetical protein